MAVDRRCLALEVTDEFLVDLEHADGEVLEIAKAAVAGAEVIQGDAAPQPSHAFDEHLRDALVMHKRRFGDFEHDQPRVYTVIDQPLLHVPEEAGLADRCRGHVDGDRMPCRGIHHRQLKHSPIDVADQSVLFGDRQERRRGDHLARRRDQAHEQFVVSGPARRDLDDRLRVEHQTILVKRIADPSDPAQGLELSTLPQGAALLFGDVAERDHTARPILKIHGR